MENEKALEKFITETARTLASHTDGLAGHTAELKKVDAEFAAFHEAMKKQAETIIELRDLVMKHEDLLNKLDAAVTKALAERDLPRVEHKHRGGGVN